MASLKSNKKGKKRKAKKVVVATRTSSRVPRDEIPIAKKATNRAMAKDCYSGNSGSSNPFTVLNNTPIVLLQQVIGDLDISIDNVEEQIDIFRAEELSRAVVDGN